LSGQARRLVCLAGVQRSFENAELLLKELCGWHVSDERIRQACHAEADRIAEQREKLPTGFSPTSGEFEFQTDATKVNTDTGWRDMKIGIFAQRKQGESCNVEDWDQRVLPKPLARLAFGAIEEIDVFANRWEVWSRRLDMKSFERLSVIADGASWIWNAAADRFPGHRGVLDIYHASEHMAATANVLFGMGTSESRVWLEETRRAVLGDGWYGFQEKIGATLCGSVSEEGRTSIDELTRYMAGHTERLNYRLRLERGESIGSGMVEGACKQMIGRRMKQTGARWKVSNANRMAELCSLCYSEQWNDYWTAA
jgi:hypothetical protein